MDRDRAAQAARWRYDPPFDLYNTPELDQAETALFMAVPDHLYFAVLDETEDLVGFVCYGAEARVSGGDYTQDALDVGCGLRPDLTGQGIGPRVIRTALDFGRERFGARCFRATVAAFNQRAQAATRHAGFHDVARFARPQDGMEFVVFVTDVPPSPADG